MIREEKGRELKKLLSTGDTVGELCRYLWEAFKLSIQTLSSYKNRLRKPGQITKDFCQSLLLLSLTTHMPFPHPMGRVEQIPSHSLQPISFPPYCSFTGPPHAFRNQKVSCPAVPCHVLSCPSVYLEEQPQQNPNRSRTLLLHIPSRIDLAVGN